MGVTPQVGLKEIAKERSARSKVQSYSVQSFANACVDTCYLLKHNDCHGMQVPVCLVSSFGNLALPRILLGLVNMLFLFTCLRLGRTIFQCSDCS